MATTNLEQMKAAHRVLATLDYPPVEVERGYAGRTLHVDLSANTIEIRPVTQYMKDIFTGGKGFDLYLMWQSVPGPIAWDDPRNGLYFSAGPLAGTPYFSGSGKCLVTGISPHHRLGHGLQRRRALRAAAQVRRLRRPRGARQGLRVRAAGHRRRRAPRDASRPRRTRRSTPTTWPASCTTCTRATPADLQNLSVVSAGRGALHTLIGCINISFYDWKRHEPRLKQAGRGGLGSVMMNKQLKAIVARCEKNRPRWSMSVREP